MVAIGVEQLTWWHDGVDHIAHQDPIWPGPEQLCLSEQLMLPVGAVRPPTPQPRVPAGVEPVEPPDAPAALECVTRVVAETSAALGVPEPEVRWFEPRLVGDGKESYLWVLGFHTFGESVIWLSVDYATPEGLARTVAHEMTHYWQSEARRPCVDELEGSERESEAQRRAKAIVPDRSVRTPRGRKRDLWFGPERRRYGASVGTQ